MLTENTGKSIFDSGGTDGRKWQKNQKKTLEEFINSEPITFEVYNDDVIWTIDLFHYLTSDCELEIDALCEAFNEVNINADNWDGGCGISVEALEVLKKAGVEEIEIAPINTYNYDSNLSQGLQYTIYEIEDKNNPEYVIRYIALQIHNGCDIRGGYTDARLFVSDYLPPERGSGIVKIFGKEYDINVDGTEIFDDNGSLLYIEDLFAERINEIKKMYNNKGIPIPEGIENITAENFDNDIEPFLSFIEAYEAENKDNSKGQLCLDIS